MSILAAKDLRPGDRVDLETCPYLHNAPSAEFEYALVVEVVRESPGCVFVGYDGLGGCGYDPDLMLGVRDA